MHVDVVENLERFNELRANWDSVYDADPEAHFFLSWTFMAGWLARLHGPWFILAAKPSPAASTYVAFFPLRLRTREHSKGSGFYNDINMAGNFGADYTGFICRPEAEEQAIPGLGRYMRQMNWTNLHLEGLRASPHRLELFLAQFSAGKFDTNFFQRINSADQVNNCICPYAELPGDWDRYLDGLSSNTRQKIRRFLRQVDGSKEFRITCADKGTAERDIKTLLQFWATKWGPRKRERTERIVRTSYATLMRAFESGSLYLPVFWKDDRPLGALASFLDFNKKALLFYMAGRDDTWNTPPAGLVLHGHSIRFAIENGFRTYDFLRGNEAYKYSFAAKEGHINCARISTKNRRNLGDRLDRRSAQGVLKRAVELHKAGKFPQAERAYRQVLEIAPREPTALYCLGQLLAKQRRFSLAKNTFRKLVDVKPDAFKAWLGLGTTLHAAGRFSDAERAYREVIKLRPDIVQAHRNLGLVLLKLGRPAEAADIFQTALELKSNDAQAKSGLAKALQLIERTSSDRSARLVPTNGKFYSEATAITAPSSVRLH